MANATAVPAKVKLLLRLLDIDGNPYASTKCTLNWDNEPSVEKITDGNGVLEAEVSSKEFGGTLTVQLFTDASKNPELSLILKTPSSADTVEGVKRRLNNLGYLALVARAVGDMDDAALRSLERFRYANGIVDASGKAIGPVAAPFDQQTQKRMENAHDEGGALESLLPPTPAPTPTPGE